MAYEGGKSGRPAERASKIGHAALIESDLVRRLLRESRSTAQLQRRAHRLTVRDLPVLDRKSSLNLQDSGFDHVVAIDSGRRTITLPERERRSTITFLSIGAVHLDVKRVIALETIRFLSPQDVADTYRVEKFLCALPDRYLSRRNLNEEDSFRLTLHEFMVESDEDGQTLYDTLDWLISRKWRPEDAQTKTDYPAPHVMKSQDENGRNRTHIRESPGHLLTDTFESHRLAGQGEDASSHAMRIIEQLLAVHQYRRAVRKGLAESTLIILDGPLTVFKAGNGRNKILEALLDMVSDMSKGLLPQMYVVGLEKNGVLAQHSKTDLSGDDENDLLPGHYVVADHEHIKWNLPHQVRRPSERYGRNTYWAVPVLVRTRSDVHYAASLLSNNIEEFTQEPEFLWQLERIVNALDGLESAMYEDALMPIALANESVSLAQSPGETILTQLVREELGQG